MIKFSSQVLEDDQDDKNTEQPNTNIEYDDTNNYHESVEPKVSRIVKYCRDKKLRHSFVIKPCIGNPVSET